MKAASKEVFLEFWEEPKESERYKHEGIYHSQLFGEGDQLVQVILLDTRTFRSPLKRTGIRRIRYKHRYRPNKDKDATLLGSQQWLWLEEQFKQDATVRIVASSIQFGHEYNGYESWTNMPNEQQKMIDLIAKHMVEGVVFISGDVHHGEISKREPANTYNLYDVTSSGLTHAHKSRVKNEFRVREIVSEKNFGFIEIDWSAQVLALRVYNKDDLLKVEQLVFFSDMRFE